MPRCLQILVAVFHCWSWNWAIYDEGSHWKGNFLQVSLTINRVRWSVKSTVFFYLYLFFINQSFINSTTKFYLKWVTFFCFIFQMNYLRLLWIIWLCLSHADRLQFWKAAVDLSFRSRKMTGFDSFTAPCFIVLTVLG